MSNPILLPIVSHYTLSYDGDNVQFLLDPSVLPQVISQKPAQMSPSLVSTYQEHGITLFTWQD